MWMWSGYLVGLTIIVSHLLTHYSDLWLTLQNVNVTSGRVNIDDIPMGTKGTEVPPDKKRNPIRFINSILYWNSVWRTLVLVGNGLQGLFTRDRVDTTTQLSRDLFGVWTLRIQNRPCHKSVLITWLRKMDLCFRHTASKCQARGRVGRECHLQTDDWSFASNHQAPT